MIIRNGIRHLSGGGENVIEISLEDYKTLATNGKIKKDTTYYIYDAEAELDASQVMFDDTNTQIGVDNIQDAIGKLNENMGGLRFATDGEGNYGYLKADDSFVPFKSGGGHINEYHGIDGKAGLNYTTSNECIVTLVVSSAKKLNTSNWQYEYYYDVNPETKIPTLLTVTGGEVERLGYTEHILAGCVRTEGDLEITMTDYVACVGQMIFRCTPSEDTMTLQVGRVIGEYGMGYFIEKVPKE